jgi:hypothetical protein
MRKALFLLLLASCGDGKRMALEDFLAARDDANCARLTRCGLFNESICDGYFRSPDYRALLAAVDGGKLDYDGAATYACLDELATVGCDRTQRDTREETPACASVFRGGVSDGKACAFDDECRSGKCDAPTCTRDVCCPGTCAAASSGSPGGGPCQVDANCTNGYCTKSKQCAPRVTEGKICDDTRACDFGLACIGLTDLQAGNCRRLPLIGESCPYLQCAELAGTCVNFTCLALGLPGEPCTADDECSPFAQCDETRNVCIDTPTLGMACDVYCAGEAWCDASVCVAPRADGDMCSADNQCLSTDCIEGLVFDVCNPTAVCF